MVTAGMLAGVTSRLRGFFAAFFAMAGVVDETEGEGFAVAGVAGEPNFPARNPPANPTVNVQMPTTQGRTGAGLFSVVFMRAH